MRPEVERTNSARWHRTDWMALLSGMLFVGVGIVFIVVPAVESLVMISILLGGLGFAGLVAIFARAVRG
ncbi:hypothetical protein OHA77_14920 [Streptosporangium sp. NBC_01639]|uniref:hypothetical protein n=1 Tax=unclassified Streptosporangium TaxID=2632669 RepID=UPI002DD9B580|nr:hypothetical protein [Streptosporangium sp. NBC_01756]WSC83624.1 hypothetical protein OIE48_24840 [Streptosporangium sp. NBC_01756]WTD57769.1 hypothetical protein OHA77_14920 [Streptosporangium sp. NBC_01639]